MSGLLQDLRYAVRQFRKEWKQVIQSYESMLEDLSQTEAAELAYAQQILAGETVDTGPAPQKEALADLAPQLP
jgi:hypothetical protein